MTAIARIPSSQSAHPTLVGPSSSITIVGNGTSDPTVVEDADPMLGRLTSTALGFLAFHDVCIAWIPDCIVIASAETCGRLAAIHDDVRNDVVDDEHVSIAPLYVHGMTL